MELAGYTIGSFISDLDVMASRLRRILDSDRGPPLLRDEQDLASHESGEYPRYRKRLAAWHLAEAERDRLAAEGTR